MVIVAMMVIVSRFLSDLGFLHRFILWFVNAGDCGENHDIQRKYEGKNFHNLNAKIKDNWNFLILFFASYVAVY